MNRIAQQIRLYCKVHKMRCPNKKLAVAEQLAGLDHFIDAMSLYLVIRNTGRRISPATVYLSLTWLTEHGFAERYWKKHDLIMYRAIDIDMEV